MEVPELDRFDLGGFLEKYESHALYKETQCPHKNL